MPVPSLLGLVVVVLLLAGFQSVVYGIAGVVMGLGFIVQAIPWNQDPVPGASQR
jgi:ABC-type phosphate transport system permease subunit